MQKSSRITGPLLKQATARLAAVNPKTETSKKTP
jgi:hypothetical protein